VERGTEIYQLPGRQVDKPSVELEIGGSTFHLPVGLIGNLARLGGLQCPETVCIRPNPRSDVAENSTPFDRLAIPPSRERRSGRAYGQMNVYGIPDRDLADG
jgi:hypothetical protein